jgi:hypothetical protein
MQDEIQPESYQQMGRTTTHKPKHLPKPGIEVKEPDKRCPRLECKWVTKRGRYQVFDCENRGERFCRASVHPWCPDGDVDNPIPPSAEEDWTGEAQHTWYEFIRQHPGYKPCCPPLAYTVNELKHLSPVLASTTPKKKTAYWVTRTSRAFPPSPLKAAQNTDENLLFNDSSPVGSDVDEDFEMEEEPVDEV